MTVGVANSNSASDAPFQVVIAGGGVAALELALALDDLASGHLQTLVIAPNAEFLYRAYAVRAPFSYAPPHQYPMQRIVRDAGAQLLCDKLAWVDPGRQVIHTAQGESIEYDALAIAVGASPRPRYKHAVTVDDARLDEILHGLIQDVEEGFVRRLSFIVPPRITWPLPIYELALMTAARAFDMNVELATSIITPESAPLAIFGAGASDAVAALLRQAGIETLTSSYAEVTKAGQIAIDPGDRRLDADRIVALPELYGPAVRGLPASFHGFLRVDRYCQVPHVGPVYAAGDVVDFAIKHGGISAQQAVVAARAIARLAGAAVELEPFKPVIRGMLLTGDRPRYLSARIAGGQGFSSEITDTPMWSPPGKVVSRYLGPYLDNLDREMATKR